MSAERYFTIEDAASELANIVVKDDDLRESMRSFGIPETEFNKMKAERIESQKKSFIDKLMKAAIRGDIAVRAPGSNLPYSPKIRRDFYERMSVIDIDAWLERSGVSYRLGNASKSKPKAKNGINQEWQTKLEGMAAELKTKNKKSRATKARLAKTLGANINIDPATIERQTRKTW